jgi:phosphatidylglycerophosphate synthase
VRTSARDQGQFVLTNGPLMSRSALQGKTMFRVLVAILGAASLAYMIAWAGPGRLLQSAKSIGWGMVFVIALAGVSHVVKTCAWRLALLEEAEKLSFPRSLAIRLVSEAFGQFGFAGLVFGESTRVALLGPETSIEGGISSVVLDRGVFLATGAVVTIAGLFAATTGFAMSGMMRVYACLSALVLISLLVLVVLAFKNRWPLLSAPARTAAQVPWLRKRLVSRMAMIESAEHLLFEFHAHAPGAFWASVLLNLSCQFLAVAEVFLILHFLGARVSLLGALILESLTKVINVIGAINPGNLGTYEGGNMAIGRLLGLSGTEGLTLGLCRRLRALFWAAVGGICLAWLSRSNRHSSPIPRHKIDTEDQGTPLQENEQGKSQSYSSITVAIVLANDLAWSGWFEPFLTRVGTLPILLRAILGVHSTNPERIIVVLNQITGPQIELDLTRTRRLPSGIEWKEVAPGASLSSIIRLVLPTAGRARVLLVYGDRTYQPALHRMVSELDGQSSAFELATGSEPVGLFALSPEAALELASDSEPNVITLQNLHGWMARKALSDSAGFVDFRMVEENSWQQISIPQDRFRAEQKLNRWLIKPTDGVFARMNRKVSIPISRQLIKYPITPNMVSLFALGVSFAAGAFFAQGGYWHTLAGAVLSVWASIFDGCDGEVARLKLQASDFGTWLETFCDYLYYLFLFAGMAIGLARSKGDPVYLAWGGALFLGAITTFFTASLSRKGLSGKHPEQFLAVWQRKAESRSSNPVLYVGRYTEFIIRRCFLPYAILAFSLVNLTQVALYMSAVGANLAWIISCYSYVVFCSKSGAVTRIDAPSETKPLKA